MKKHFLVCLLFWCFTPFSKIFSAISSRFLRRFQQYFQLYPVVFYGKLPVLLVHLFWHQWVSRCANHRNPERQGESDILFSSFSSHVHEVLKVTYCDLILYVVRKSCVKYVCVNNSIFNTLQATFLIRYSGKFIRTFISINHLSPSTLG